MTTIYYTAASLDGYLADEHGSLDWLFEVPRETDGREEVGAFFARIGAFAMGATTYEWMLDNLGVLERPEEWRSWYGTVPAWVFTHRDLPSVPGIPITFVNGDITPVHGQMVAAARPKDVWLVGTGELVGRFMDAGLVDEIHVSIQPVVLGGGSPLLPRRVTSASLSLASVQRRRSREPDLPRSLNFAFGLRPAPRPGGCVVRGCSLVEAQPPSALGPEPDGGSI